MTSAGIPFSSVVKLKEIESNEDGEHRKKSREEWKKAKELEEARKAGTVPAAVDEEGRDINPHIPQYISSAPWYFGSFGPTLKHQRPQLEKEKVFNKLNEHYVRGVSGMKAKKFRKGACENCGAMGHTKKECFERPRKVGAKYSNSNIFPDDFILPELSLDYDGKRDRWNGFNPAEYKAVVEEHQKVEEYKRQLKAKKLKEGEEVDSDTEEDIADDEDEKYAENIDMPGTKVDSKQRITVRNLRIREDTAKYLRNLDPDSAYYDPKTRSMRDNPYKGTRKLSEVDYTGENFVRFSGDTIEQAKAQLFAWEASEKGVDVSLQSEPTKLEILKREFMNKKAEFKEKISSSLLVRYGGKIHLEVPPQELLLAQTENYVEYSRQGKIIKGAEKNIIRSKYEEDIYPNNHVTIWGSYWQSGKWGYKCCYSFIKNSFCTGNAGKSQTMPLIISGNDNKAEIELLPQHTVIKKRKLREKKVIDSYDSNSEEKELQKKKLRAMLIKAKLEEDDRERIAEIDESKREYNSMYENKKLTEEEIEAYKIRRVRPEDPMASSFMK